MSEEDTFWTFIAMMRGYGMNGDAVAYVAAYNDAESINKKSETSKGQNKTSADTSKAADQTVTTLEGLYMPGLPLTKQYMFQMEFMLNKMMPTLAQHMEAQCAIPTMYASQWFLTLFTYDLPFEVLLRVWDVFFSEGVKILFRVGLALLQMEESELLSLQFEHLVGRIRTMPNHPETTADVLIRTAVNIPVSVMFKESVNKYLNS